jgi:hypothetical protein
MAPSIHASGTTIEARFPSSGALLHPASIAVLFTGRVVATYRPELIAANPGALNKADVVFITDGGSDTTSAPQLRERANSLDVTTIGLGIGVQREWLAHWCDDIQVVTDLNHIDDSSAEMLFAR